MVRTQEKNPMAKTLLPELTTSELTILKVLWRKGPLSAREIHNDLENRCKWSYSTTRTHLERMVKKGLLTKDPFHGIYLYASAISKARGLAQSVRNFAENVVELELSSVVNLFTGGQVLTANELEELQQLLHMDPKD